MTKDQIKLLALGNGFKLKEQPDGSMDLNPYVYEFANAMFVKGAVTVLDDVIDDLDINENANTMASVLSSVKRHTSGLSDSNRKLLEKLAADAMVDDTRKGDSSNVSTN